MSKPVVLLILGSLRNNGFNTQLAQHIEDIIGDQATVRRLDYKDLPWMNQDLENPEQESVAAVREAVREADGVWFVTPQYNSSFPGHIKNIIDWLSRPLPGKGRGSVVISGKKVTVSGAGGRTATAPMRQALDTLLSFVGANVMSEPETGIALSGPSWASGNLTLSDEDESALEAQVKAFLAFIAQ